MHEVDDRPARVVRPQPAKSGSTAKSLINSGFDNCRVLVTYPGLSLNQNGTLNWMYMVAANIAGRVQRADEAIYFGSGDQLYAFRP